jgi:hypothetical protein
MNVGLKKGGRRGSRRERAYFKALGGQVGRGNVNFYIGAARLQLQSTGKKINKFKLNKTILI